MDKKQPERPSRNKMARPIIILLIIVMIIIIITIIYGQMKYGDVQ